MHAADTSAEVHDRRMAALRRLSAREKLGEVTRLSELTSELAAVGIRLRHPDYDEAAVRWALLRLLRGDQLFRAVWPEAPLLDP
ncbi:MAG: hypothetical protein AB7W59_02935 [Acidimicrobiia bacterium]